MLCAAVFVSFGVSHYQRMNWGEYIEWKDGVWKNKEFTSLEVVVACVISATITSVPIFVIAWLFWIFWKKVKRKRALPNE